MLFAGTTRHAFNPDAPISVDSAFSGAYQELPPGLPKPVSEHIRSLHGLIDDLGASGIVSESAATFLGEFADRHDVGYGTDIARLDTSEGQRVLRATLEDVDATVSAEDVSEYLQGNSANYLASRILGHGVLGVVENTQFYEERGLPPDEALGRAELLAAHHPGFPVTMVSGFASGEAATTPELRRGLLIGEPDDAEVVRAQLIEAAAGRLHLPVSDVAYAAVLGYAVDRLTPGRLPEAIRIREAGAITITGGEVFQKKYGLVAGDLSRDPQLTEPTIASLYETVAERLHAEANAAVDAAQFAGQDELTDFILAKSQEIAQQTNAQQAGALAALHHSGFSGAFADLANERHALLQEVLHTNDPSLAYALATYDAIIDAL